MYQTREVETILNEWFRLTYEYIGIHELRLLFNDCSVIKGVSEICLKWLDTSHNCIFLTEKRIMKLNHWLHYTYRLKNELSIMIRTVIFLLI